MVFCHEDSLASEYVTIMKARLPPAHFFTILHVRSDFFALHKRDIFLKKDARILCRIVEDTEKKFSHAKACVVMGVRSMDAKRRC